MALAKRRNDPDAPGTRWLAHTNCPRAMARLLEDRETERLGKLSIAREALARRIGCAPGTLETLRKGRLKRIEGWLQRKLEVLLVREIEAEIRRLTRELETYRRAGGDLGRSAEMARLVETVDAARRLIASAAEPEP